MLSYIDSIRRQGLEWYLMTVMTLTIYMYDHE